MTHKRISLGLLAAAMLAVLAVIGVVNGLWSKNLVVNGTVETGDLRVDWSTVSCTEFWTWPDPPTTDEDEGEFLEKDVGWTTSSIGDAEFGDQVLNLVLHNVYPSYAVDCEVHWINTGSIPVNFAGFTIVPLPGFDPLTDCVLTPIGGGTTKFLECNELTVVFVDGLDDQIDPCAPDTPVLQCDQAAHSILIHVEQLADQSVCSATGTGTPWQIGGPGQANNADALDCDEVDLVSYGFAVKLCAAQWNEAATYNECVNSPQHEGPGGEFGSIDVTEDPGTTNPFPEGHPCNDGVDNDGDGDTDWPDDTGCVVQIVPGNG